MGKDIRAWLEKITDIDWNSATDEMREKLRPYAQKAGRTAVRPLLQFYYVMADEETSSLDRALIYAAIIYTVSPISLIPSAVYKLLGVLDEGAAVMYVYNKVKERITPVIERKVENTLEDWFGADYEIIED